MSCCGQTTGDDALDAIQPGTYDPGSTGGGGSSFYAGCRVCRKCLGFWLVIISGIVLLAALFKKD